MLIRSRASAILNGPTLTISRRRAEVVGLGQIALNSAPVLGGVMLAIAAGQFRGPDYRALIKQDMDLLDRLPPEATARRAELQRTIDARIDDLIDASDKSRALRRAATSYHGNWRDIVLLLSVVLFAVVWWNANHSRANWLPTFIVLILLAVVAAGYALRGVLRAASSFLRRLRADDQQRLPGADVPK
jgi:hypothetical protein